MKRKELIAFCLTFPGVYEDYPFDNVSTVMKINPTGKMFALLGDRHDREYINLKCEPMHADFFRQRFTSVIPGWHMNKEHWNTIWLDGDVPDDELLLMVEASYYLVNPKLKQRK